MSYFVRDFTLLDPPCGNDFKTFDIPWIWRSADDGEHAHIRCYVEGKTRDTRWQPLKLLMDLAGASSSEIPDCHYVVETDIPTEVEADFNAWYTEEHLPGLARVPGTIRARRFLRVHPEGAPRYIACYDLVNAAVLNSAPWLAVRGSVWSDRIRPHFLKPRRTLYVPYEP